MSLRVDTSSLISGALVCGNRGLGVLGSEVPSTGDNGPGFIYNDLTLPADAGKEVRGLIVTPPAAGTLFAYEDSSFTFSAPDGSYSFVYRLYVDGVDQGTATVSLTVGAATQLLAPSADLSAGGWTPSSGSDLYAMLDETTASDADYIVSSTASSCEISIAVGSDPAVSTGHILRYRLLSGSGSIAVALKQGSTTIASWGPHTLTGSAQDFAQTLSGGQADSITDYSDLRVVFTAS